MSPQGHGRTTTLGNERFTLHGSIQEIVLVRMIAYTFRRKKMLAWERHVLFLTETMTGTVESDVILSAEEVALQRL